MGFFADLKEDLNQAVNELLPGEEKDEASAGASVEELLETGTTAEQMANLEELLQNIDELKIIDPEPEEPAKEKTLGDDGLESVDFQNLGEVEELEDIQDLEEAMEDLNATMASLQMTMANLQETEEKSAEPQIMVEEPQITVQEPETPISDLPVQEPIVDVLPQESEVASLEESLRATFGAAEGEESVEDYMEKEAIRTGAKVIDKSWILNLKDLETTDETAIITAGMRVKGDILSNGSIDIIGEVQGNVQVVGKLNVTGKILGNSKAEEVFADAAKITGDIICDGTVKIGAGSVVKGNIEAAGAVIAGAVKGTIDVKGPVILDASAVVLGNIRAKSMQINNGARIEGMCVLCYAEQSAAKFFENQDEM